MKGCHGKQKANSHNGGKNGLKMFVVVVSIKKTTSETASSKKYMCCI